MRGDVVVEKITYTENLVDPFTKTLSTRAFDEHKGSIGVRCISNMF